MGVIHRDLKPANLMMTESGAIKIMDFGIARVAGSDHLTHAGHMMGTPAYMAPEQVLGKDVDARANLYSMGVVLYRLVTGKLPFKGETALAMAQSQVNNPPTPVRLARDSVPPGWVEILTARALAKSPADRFQSAEEFCHALRSGVSGFPLDAVTTAGVPSDRPATTLAVDIEAPTVASARPAPASSAVTEHSKGPATITLKRSNLTALVAGGALIVLLLIGVGGYLIRSRTPAAAPASVPAPAPAPAAAAPAPAVAPPPQPASAPPAQAAPAAKTPETVPSTTAAKTASSQASSPGPVTTTAAPTRGRDGSVAGAAAATGAPSAVGGTSSAAGGPPSVAGATSPPRGRANPAVATDPPVAFVNVKMLEVKGTKADDQEVVLNLAAGQMSLVPKKGGTALRSISYGHLVRGTYSRSKDPQWDPSLSSPPEKLDIPGMFRSSRHWLTLQTSTDYLVLQLADENWAGILQTIESRTGLTIDRRPSK